jgi:two-component system, LytTR family, sensor histidine kinase AlgZ
VSINDPSSSRSSNTAAATTATAGGKARTPKADAPSATPQGHAASAGYNARLPDFCNLGVIWRVLVIVNLLVLAAAVVRSDVPRLINIDGSNILQQFLLISIVAQPAIILSLVLCCGLKKLIGKLTYWRGVSVIFTLEGAISLVFYEVHRSLAAILPAGEQVSPLQFIFFFVVVTAVVLYYFDLRARSLAPAITEARLQALQARIRPHFLFNSINAVLSLIRAEPRRAERMLEDMAELFRVLMADNRQLKPLADEVELCRRYLEIEQIRLGERLKVEWRNDNMPADALVPPLILQPLIENAVYHGIEPREGVGVLTIDIAANGKQLNIALTNPFHSRSTHVSGNRMAIANIRERLQLHFDAEASLNANVVNQQYIVTINMPIVMDDHTPRRLS